MLSYHLKFSFHNFWKVLLDFCTCIKRKYKHSILINVLFKIFQNPTPQSYFLTHICLYVCFSITVLALVLSWILINWHYLKELLMSQRISSKSLTPILKMLRWALSWSYQNLFTECVQTTTGLTYFSQIVFVFCWLKCPEVTFV